MWIKDIIIRKERSRRTKGGCRVTRDIPECNEAIENIVSCAQQHVF